MKIWKALLLFLLEIPLVHANIETAEPIAYFTHSRNHYDQNKYTSATAACAAAMPVKYRSGQVYIEYTEPIALNSRDCGYTVNTYRLDGTFIASDAWQGNWLESMILICPESFTFDANLNLCVRSKKQDDTCPVGNPILTGTGTKREEQVDYKQKSPFLNRLNLIRQYSSVIDYEEPNFGMGGNWSFHQYHNNLSFLDSSRLQLHRSFDEKIEFTKVNNVWGNNRYKNISLTQKLEGGITYWEIIYLNEFKTELYNSVGRLIEITFSDGTANALIYSDSTTPLSIAPQPGLLIGVTGSGTELIFIYNENANLLEIKNSVRTIIRYRYEKEGQSKNAIVLKESYSDSFGKKIYSYELPKSIYPKIIPTKIHNINFSVYESFNTGKYKSYWVPDSLKDRFVKEDHGDKVTRSPVSYLLSGVIDEQGKTKATWTYDTQGRAISSEHAGGADKTLLSFNADGSTTVTNPLGKKTIYRFADIAGARRVVKVEGQPTTNCAGANQNYTYTPDGWLESKTDWKGIKTTFQYNTSGQEISRTEAFGTADARTITTEWHPAFYVKTKVTEPGKETTFSYGVNGRLENQTIRAVNN